MIGREGEYGQVKNLFPVYFSLSLVIIVMTDGFGKL